MINLPIDTACVITVLAFLCGMLFSVGAIRAVGVPPAPPAPPPAGDFPLDGTPSRR